ncbi:MAG: hypothetical protein H6953_19085 [Chromatiaceae bacterium]|nr:hypothetical protein [Chromatiaceae bacterium]
MTLGPEGADVPQMFIQSAFAAGAVPADSEPDEFVAEPKATVGNTHAEQVQAGIKTMLERDDASDFTASGMPDRRKLAKLVGLNVTPEDLADAWKTLNESAATA